MPAEIHDRQRDIGNSMQASPSDGDRTQVCGMQKQLRRPQAKHWLEMLTQ